MGQLAVDEHGFPVLLADVPGAGVSTIDPNAKSGNPAHDVRSGKFGAGGPPPDPKQALGPNIDPVEANRMMDAVRAAAREFELPQEGDIREWLKGNSKNPAQVDVAGFMKAVQEQIKNDLVDILDSQLRSTGQMARGRRVVRVTAPRGFMQKAMRSLSSADAAEVMHRLEARGHDAADVERRFANKLKPDHHAAAVDQKNALAASSEDWVPDTLYFSYDDEESEDEDRFLFASIAESVAKNLPAPIVNVTVEPTPPRRMEVVRDPETKLLIGTREVEDGG